MRSPGSSVRPDAYPYLDAMRFLLAAIVAFSHSWYLLIADYRAQTSGLVALGYVIAGFSHASVILFFVLSGYWITRSVRRRALGGWYWPDYLADRLIRLLLVLIPALAMGGVLDGLAIAIFRSPTHLGLTGTYVLRADVSANLAFEVLLGNLLFLQGIFTAPYGTNGPLWSLAYEFWFYIWFPALFLTWRRGKLSAALLTLLLAFQEPRLLLGFACWLCGAAAAFSESWIAARRPKAVPSARWLLLPAAALLLIALALVRSGWLAHWELPLAATFALFLLVLLLAKPPGGRWLDPLAAYGRSASFSLYAIHFPIIAFVAGLTIGTERLPATVANAAFATSVFAMTLVIARAFSVVTEGRTAAMQARIRSLMARNREGRPGLDRSPRG